MLALDRDSALLIATGRDIVQFMEYCFMSWADSDGENIGHRAELVKLCAESADWAEPARAELLNLRSSPDSTVWWSRILSSSWSVYGPGNPFYGPGNPFYGPDYPFYGPGLFKSRVLVSDQTGLASAHFFYWRYGLITHTGVYRTVLYLICLLGHAQVWMERTAWSACWCGIIVDVAQPAHRAMSMLLSTI